MLLKLLRAMWDFFFPPTPTPEPGPEPDPTPPPEPTFEDRLIALVNQERLKRSLPPVSRNDQLSLAAQKHTQHQSDTGRMSHRGSRGSQVGDRVREEGYHWSNVGEIVASGYSSPESVINGWMSSRGHRNIILGNFAETGFGKVGSYWTGVFASQ